MKENNILFSLISPTRGDSYSLKEVLEKGFSRSQLVGDVNVALCHTCFYGSKDYRVTIKELTVSDSLWNESVSFIINGKIPVHATNNGKLSFGFGCGCDTRHGGQFPSNADPDNPKWDLYKQKEIEGVVCVRLGDKSQSVPIDNFSDEEKNVLLKLVKELLVRKYFF